MAPRATPEGTWEIRWRDANGKQHKRRYKRQEDARQDEIRVLGQVQSGSFIDPKRGNITVTEWSAKWLTSAHNLKPRSKEIYEAALAHILPALGGYRLALLVQDVEPIDRYLVGRLDEGAAPSTVHREYRTLKRMGRLAVDRGYIVRSFMADVVEPRVPTEEMRFLTPDEVATAAVAIDHRPKAKVVCRYASWVLVESYGGLRWAESAGLEIPRIDWAGNRVQVVGQLDESGKLVEPKSRYGRRWVALPEIAMDSLKEQTKGRLTGPVWTMPAGGHLEHSRFQNRIWYTGMNRAGLGVLTITHTYGPGIRRKRVIASTTRSYDGVRIHDLRHTAVALAIKAGAHPKAIQMRMGHSSIRVTLDIYGHLYSDMDDDLAIALNAMMATARPRLVAV